MSDDSDDAWWKTMGIGLVCLALTAFLFWSFSSFEASGGSMRIHWIIAALYNLGGKWLTCSVTGLLGIALVGKGIQELKDGQ